MQLLYAACMPRLENLNTILKEYGRPEIKSDGSVQYFMADDTTSKVCGDFFLRGRS